VVVLAVGLALSALSPNPPPKPARAAAQR
jgi:hypothetical protein